MEFGRSCVITTFSLRHLLCSIYLFISRSGNFFTQSWISECYTNYTSDGSYSRQYTCDNGCPQQQSFDGNSCSGTATQTVNLGSCILCDDSGDYCADTSGAAEKMVSMVFAVVAGALWGTM